MKTTFPSLLLFVVLITCSEKSVSQSVEFFSGNANTQVDIQWLKPFKEGSPFLFYNRTRLTVDYDNRTDYFISGITAYQFKNGIGIANEMNVTNAGLLPKLGPQYLSASPDRTIYAFINAGYLDEWVYGLFCFARFQPKVSDKVRLYLQLEIVNSSSKEGNQFFAQRPRLGIGVNQIQFGFAADLTEIGKDFKFDSNVGAFIRKEF